MEPAFRVRAVFEPPIDKGLEIGVQLSNPLVVMVAQIDGVDDMEGQAPHGRGTAFGTAGIDHVHTAVFTAAGDVRRWRVDKNAENHLLGQNTIRVAQAHHVQRRLAQHHARHENLHRVPGLGKNTARPAHIHAQGFKIVKPALLPRFGPITAEEGGGLVK